MKKPIKPTKPKQQKLKYERIEIYDGMSLQSLINAIKDLPVAVDYDKMFFEKQYDYDEATMDLKFEYETDNAEYEKQCAKYQKQMIKYSNDMIKYKAFEEQAQKERIEELEKELAMLKRSEKSNTSNTAA